MDSFIIKKKIYEIVEHLNRYKTYTEREFGLFKMTVISVPYALRLYYDTILNVTPGYSMEPPSALYMSNKRPIRVDWNTKRSEIGYIVTVHADGEVRPEFYDAVTDYAEAGFPFGSTGGIYCRVPNKSFSRIKQLLEKGIIYTQPPKLYHAEELWVNFWAEVTAMRHEKSMIMLAQKSSMPDILSIGNEASGTGVYHRGIRLKRKDLDEIKGEELEYLVHHMAGSAICFAASQIADLAPHEVVLIEILDPRIVGAVGSRSDCDITEAKWTKPDYITQSEVQTRQIFANGGIIANSDGERKLFGSSVTSQIWLSLLKKYGLENEIFPPFRGLEHLIQLWTSHTEATAKEGEDVVIGEDIGMVDPLKAGADNLFARSFQKIGTRVMPDLGSGSWYTTLTYVFFHLLWGMKLKSLHIPFKMVPLGDDVNILLKKEHVETFKKVIYPYEKIKSTKGNLSKILGMLTIRREKEWTLMVTPRVQKTLSSASQQSSLWVEELPEQVGESGSASLVIPDEIERSVQEALPIVSKMVYFKGSREEIATNLRRSWGEGSHLREFGPDYLPNWTRFWEAGLGG